MSLDIGEVLKLHSISGFSKVPDGDQEFDTDSGNAQHRTLSGYRSHIPHLFGALGSRVPSCIVVSICAFTRLTSAPWGQSEPRPVGMNLNGAALWIIEAEACLNDGLL